MTWQTPGALGALPAKFKLGTRVCNHIIASPLACQLRIYRNALTNVYPDWHSCPQPNIKARLDIYHDAFFLSQK